MEEGEDESGEEEEEGDDEEVLSTKRVSGEKETLHIWAK